MRDPNNSTVPAVRIIGAGSVPVWGLSGDARLSRALLALGVTDCAPWPAPVRQSAAILVIDAGFIIEDSLLQLLLASPGKLLLDPASGRIAAAHIPLAHGAEMAALIQRQSRFQDAQLPPALQVEPLSVEETTGYNAVLKKRMTGFILPIEAAAQPQIERYLFNAAYKGVTDIVTKYVWPWPAYHVTRACAALGITPNMVTSLSGVCVIVAFLLFMNGQFGYGLVAAWSMTFLDTVDGKLARVTLNSSPFGNIFDHGIDLVHPPFWYWAWALGITAAGLHLEHAEIIMAIVIGGYVAQRLMEGGFKLAFGFTLHVWRPFDSRFRLITARRNPNLIILTLSVLGGRPDIGMLLVAVWTVCGMAVHLMQLIQAAVCSLRGQPPRSWLAN